MGAEKPASYSAHYGLEKPPAKAAPEHDQDDQAAAPDELPAEGGGDEHDEQGQDSPDDPHADTDDDADDAADSGDSGNGGGRQPVSIPGGKLAGAGAGWVLGVLLWGWVVLPFFKGGPVQVANTLRAKFVNQAPDGSQLP